MQAHFLEVYFRQAKIVFFYPKKIIYPLLLPSHNCIIITMFSFQGTFWISRDSMKFQLIVGTSVSLFLSVNLFLEVVGQNGLEPSTSRLSVVCSSQLSYWPIWFHFFWWRLAGSNRWPPACKAGALPAELNPHMVFTVFRYILLYLLNWITHPMN